MVVETFKETKKLQPHGHKAWRARRFMYRRHDTSSAEGTCRAWKHSQRAGTRENIER